MEKGKELRQARGLLAFIGAGGGRNRLQVRPDDRTGLPFERWAFQIGGELFAVRMGTQARNERFGEDAAADRHTQGMCMAGNGDFSDIEGKIRARM